MQLVLNLSLIGQQLEVQFELVGESLRGVLHFLEVFDGLVILGLQKKGVKLGKSGLHHDIDQVLSRVHADLVPSELHPLESL